MSRHLIINEARHTLPQDSPHHPVSSFSDVRQPAVARPHVKGLAADHLWGWLGEKMCHDLYALALTLPLLLKAFVRCFCPADRLQTFCFLDLLNKFLKVFSLNQWS